MADIIKFGPGNAITVVRLGQGEIFPVQFNLPIDQGPGVFAYHWVYEDKQYGHAWLDIDSSGNGTFFFKFSNGKKWDGDNFSATCTFHEMSDKPLLSLQWSAGMNSAGSTGGAKERISPPFQIVRGPAWWANVTGISFRFMQIDTVNDVAIWDAIWEALKSSSSEGGESTQSP